MVPERLRIKICGLTRPDDARAAVRCGADAVGLVFAPSTRRVDVDGARAVAAAARAEAAAGGVTVDVWGLFVNEDAGEIRRVACAVGLDVVQLHGDEPAEFAARLAGVRLVRAVRVRDASALEVVDRFWATGSYEAILLDAYGAGARGGSGRTFDWEIAGRAARRARVALAGGLTPENVGAAVARVRPYLVDVSSGVELSPGTKDESLMARFVAAARGGTASRVD